jgi:VWFA-related protein
MKRFAIAEVFALSAVATMAQQPVGESIEVRVVNVDVVVRDRAGKPVTGLTKQDFEIYESGQRQEITNLYEIRPPSVSAKLPASSPQPWQPAASAQSAANPAASEQPPEVRRRNFVMFVDNYSLALFRRDKILQSLLKFTDEHLGPRTR